MLNRNRALQIGPTEYPLFGPPLLRSVAVVAESGFFSAADIQRLTQAGADAFLIGESLVASGDPGKNLAPFIADFHGQQGLSQ
jgi:indole-3-glycerol phosphate synthase